MSKQRIIRKILVLLAWSVVIGGITTLLVAANRKDSDHLCRKVVIGIRGSAERFYIEESDIRRQLEKAAKGKLVNRPIENISLSQLEESLERNQWIRDAELYFDRDETLHVVVEERVPIARVFAASGATFYIDSAGYRMPVIEKVSARVPVITGYDLGTRLSSKDSAFLGEIRQLATTVYQDPFWNAQVGQIDITSERKFELIPVIGDHVIRIGNTEYLDQKLDRLSLFYKKVLSKAGFSKYAAIDVQYAGQVIGVYKGAVSAVDSIQLQKNIEELLQKSTIQNVSQDMLPGEGSAADSVKTQPTVSNAPVPVKKAAVVTNNNPTPPPAKAVRAAAQPERPSNVARPKRTTVEKPKPAVKTPPKKPRAVMQKKA